MAFNIFVKLAPLLWLLRISNAGFVEEEIDSLGVDTWPFGNRNPAVDPNPFEPPNPFGPSNPFGNWNRNRGNWRNRFGQRDCRWGKWKGDICTRKSDGSYVILQERKKKPATGNGRDCVETHSTREKPCKATYFVAHKFLQTVSESIEGGSGPKNARTVGLNPFDKPLPPVRNPCAKDISDDKGLRIVGKKCETVTRRRRNAEGHVEEYQEPLVARKKRGTTEDGEGGEGSTQTIKHRDVLFMIDESGSVRPENFRKELEMAKAVTGALCGTVAVGLQTTRIGVMTFDRYQNPHLNFDRHFNKFAISRSIDRIRSTKLGQDATCMVDALNFTKTDMFTKGRGSRTEDPEKEETESEKLVIMITDGCANCEAWTEDGKFSEEKMAAALTDMSADLEQSLISVITFYIGPDDECVNRIRALADGSRCYQVFAAKSWDEFEEMTRAIIESKCMDSWTVGKTC